MATLQITLFGPPRIAMAGAPVHVSLDKALALLAYLAVTRTVHRRDHLAALLWPESSQSHARAYLRNALYVLTKDCGDGCFQGDRSTLALAPDAPMQVDVWEFWTQAAAADRAQTGQDAIAHLTRAAALAEADFLAGFSLPDAPAFDEWQRLERAHLDRQVDDVLRALVAFHQAQSEFSAAVEYAQRWVARDPLNEPAHRALMQLLAVSGQKAAALRQYDAVVRVLNAELGVAPSEETDSIYHAIRDEPRTDGRHRDAHASGAPPWTPGEQPAEPHKGEARVQPVPHNLPPQPTPFVGRERELDELDRLLEAENMRLITITGPGGMGKTRLALACAERQLQHGRFPDGVYFVDLAALADADRIAPAIAASLGYVPESGRAVPRTVAQQVVDYLRPKRLLLVLDNFEHLLDGTALVGDMLPAAPAVRLLVTSREWLHLRTEYVYSIEGLDYGDPAVSGTAADTAAVRLFEQSARHSAPDFTAAAPHLSDVAQICHLVEGMPLAIELAAAWADLLSSADITEEIRRNLTFLQADLRDLPSRHHSIRAAFDATWQRLDPSEQAVFAALSVFRGGFAREAAREVAGATLQQLRSLVLKSLLQPDRRRSSRHHRYGVHELLRQYGALMLPAVPGGAASAHARHCAYFTAFLEARLNAINGPAQRQAADEIAAELDNVRAAWQWAVDHADVEAIHQAATTLFLFCQLRSHFSDGAEMMAEAAARLDTQAGSPLRDLSLAQLLNHEGWLRIRLGDFDRATAVLENSRKLYDQPHVPPPPSYMGTDPTPALAILAQIRGDHAQAIQFGEVALQVATARGDRYNQSYAHYGLTSTCAACGDYAAAAHHAEQACELAEAVGNRWFLAILLDEWGRVARATGDYAQAKQHFQASYNIKHDFDDPEGMAVALNHLGQIAGLQHDLAEAERLHRKALEMYQGIGDRVGLATSLHGLAHVAARQGQDAAARAGFAQALAIAADTQFLPLVFAILVDAGNLWLAHGQAAAGVRALVQVEQHPAVDHETKTRASESLAQWRARVDSGLYGDAIAWAQATNLASAVVALQADFIAPTAPGGAP